MKRHIIAIFTAVSLLLASQASWAQMVVYDPVQTARSSLDALEQLMQTIDDAEQFMEYKDKFDNMKSWLNDSFGEGSAYAQVKNLLVKGQRINNMTKQLNSMWKMTELYAQQLTDFQQLGYNPYLVTSFINSLTADVNVLKGIWDEFDDLLSEPGITKEKKIEMAQKTADEVTRKALQSTAKLNDEMMALEQLRGALSATNFIEGKQRDEGLQNITGGEAASRYVLGEDGPASVEGAVYQDSTWQDEMKEVSGMHSLTSTLMKVLMLLLGLVCVGSLTLGLIRYFKDTPGSQIIFVRIFVAALVGIIVLSILSQVFNL